MPREPVRDRSRARAGEADVSLRVVGVRDDGYHLLDAEMVTLDLADELNDRRDAPLGVTVSGPFADGVPTDDSNLVPQALRARRA